MTDTPLPVGTATVLGILAKGPATSYAIWKATGMTRPVLSRALDRIVGEGWATCENGPVGPWGQRRTYTITQAGREQIARHDSTENQ